MILPGSRSQPLAARIAETLDEPIADVGYDRFPDGERILSAPDLGDDVTVVASTPTDGALVELLQLLDVCRDVDDLALVLPYMGYARQDDAFADGEPVTARAVARALEGPDRVLTVDVHEPGVLDWFDAAGEDVSAAPVLADAVAGRVGADADPVVVAPDAGAASMAAAVAEIHGWSHDHMRKERLSGDEVQVAPPESDVDGRVTVLVDDIVATGGTMSEATARLLDAGAEAVHAACVHPVFARNAVTRMHRAGVDSILATDTLPSTVDRVSVAPVVADALR